MTRQRPRLAVGGAAEQSKEALQDLGCWLAEGGPFPSGPPPDAKEAAFGSRQAQADSDACLGDPSALRDSKEF